MSPTPRPETPSLDALWEGLGPTPAVAGGTPVRPEYLPVATPWIGEAEKRAVAEVLDSGWMTTGAKAHEFARRIAEMAGAAHGLALNSCTGAMHLALAALDLRPGDEVITSTWTFCSTVNVILHCGAKPVLVDVDPGTLNLNPQQVAAAVTDRTRVLLPVHFGGHPADLEPLLALARAHGLRVVEDAAHALGARYQGRPIGSFGDATCFSFYAIKNITTGEGGALVTSDGALLERAQILSLHGISKDAWKRYSATGSWYYEVTAPGFKYNLTDLAAAIGLAQLDRWNEFHERRQRLAARYDALLSGLEGVSGLQVRPDVEHARHLYPVLLDVERLSVDRAGFIEALRAENIGTTVNFIPIHRHPYYREALPSPAGRFPAADHAYERLVTLPLFPRMEAGDVDDVVRAVARLLRHFHR